MYLTTVEGFRVCCSYICFVNSSCRYVRYRLRMFVYLIVSKFRDQVYLLTRKRYICEQSMKVVERFMNNVAKVEHKNH